MSKEAAIPVEEVVEELAPQRRFRPYPEYRDSGVEWLGELAVHWQADRLKWTVTMCRNGIWGVEPDGVNDIACVRVADFDRTRFLVHLEKPTIRAVTPGQRTGRLLVNGDLLLEKSGGGELQPVGAVMLFNHDRKAVCSNFVARMPVATGFDGRFLAYFHAHLYSGRVNTRSIKQTTGIQNLDSDSYLNELMPFVPYLEQQAIVTFLDRETARIGELIAKKQRLIELLAEKRTALINHAVTKGLNPDAPMKDSGVEWLGEVPAHWSLAPLYARYWLELGKMLDAKRITGDHLVPYLRNVDVQWDRVNVEDLPEMDIAPLEYERFILSPGDLLVCEGGEVGRSAIWHSELPLCGYQKALHRLRPRSSRERVRFLYYALRLTASTGIFIAQGNPNTIPHLTGEQLRVYRLPFPPPDEQDEICTFLDTRLERLDSMGDQIANGIDKLREYRSALISATVTGKIDVREVASVVPARRANVHFHRCVLAAEIVDRHLDTPRFGRIKLQKLLILAERHLGLDEIQSQPVRAAAGPFDNRMMRAIQAQLKRQKWFDPTKAERGTKYVPMEKHGGHREYFERYWGDKHEQFDALIALLKPMTTRQTEIVATLYMAWNDFVIAGAEFDDERIVSEVLNNWDASKQSIEPDRWRRAITWMREKGLIPCGFGSPTRKGVADAN